MKSVPNKDEMVVQVMVLGLKQLKLTLPIIGKWQVIGWTIKNLVQNQHKAEEQT